MMPVYLDNHASTPVDPRVRDAMLPWLGARWGNAGSATHAFGWQAAQAVASARERAARMISAQPREIVFTSGATEADNIAIFGAAAGRTSGRVVTTAVEHHAVLDPCLALGERGFDVVVLPVDARGRVRLEDVEAAVDESTFLVSVMAANNEVGTLQPIAEIARICKARGALLHCDAAQAAGRVRIDVRAWGVDMLALSGHKFYAPQGVGLLYVRAAAPHVRLRPLMLGGGQEEGLRPGTLNVPGIVALGAAAECVVQDLDADAARIGALRDAMQRRLLEVPGARVNGHATERLAGNLSVRFDGIEAEALMAAVPSVAFSAGAACATGDRAPSPVLTAMGLGPAEARGTIRLGLGRFTTAEDADAAARAIAEAALRLRSAPGG